MNGKLDKEGKIRRRATGAGVESREPRKLTRQVEVAGEERAGEIPDGGASHCCSPLNGELGWGAVDIPMMALSGNLAGGTVQAAGEASRKGQSTAKKRGGDEAVSAMGEGESANSR